MECYFCVLGFCACAVVLQGQIWNTDVEGFPDRFSCFCMDCSLPFFSCRALVIIVFFETIPFDITTSTVEQYFTCGSSVPDTYEKTPQDILNIIFLYSRLMHVRYLTLSLCHLVNPCNKNTICQTDCLLTDYLSLFSLIWSICATANCDLHLLKPELLVHQKPVHQGKPLLNSWCALSHIFSRFSLSVEDGLDPGLVTVDLTDRSVCCLSASILSKVVNLLSSLLRSLTDSTDQLWKPAICQLWHWLNEECQELESTLAYCTVYCISWALVGWVQGVKQMTLMSYIFNLPQCDHYSWT